MTGIGRTHLRERLSDLSLRWRIGAFVMLGLVGIFALFGILGSALAQDGRQRTIDQWSAASIRAGFSALQLDLTPGNYVLICNEPGHFAAGMHLQLTVLAAPAGDE
ncbi:MAG TPA: hypothetical protein VKR80_01640 [Candidatus Limnocylindria bacterium]|nr:hypothetical protein [Candidatus Limnocylindria bacterium]